MPRVDQRNSDFALTRSTEPTVTVFRYLLICTVFVVCAWILGKGGEEPWCVLLLLVNFTSSQYYLLGISWHCAFGKRPQGLRRARVAESL